MPGTRTGERLTLVIVGQQSFRLQRLEAGEQFLYRDCFLRIFSYNRVLADFPRVIHRSLTTELFAEVGECCRSLQEEQGGLMEPPDRGEHSALIEGLDKSEHGASR
jgi:hypothetical protein